MNGNEQGDELELQPLEPPMTVNVTRTDDAGNEVVEPVDVLYQVVRPLGHFERFTFTNNTPVPTSDIGYEIVGPPGPPLHRLDAGGHAQPGETWVDLPPPGHRGTQIIVRALVETDPPCHLLLEHTSAFPAEEGWVIRRADIEVRGDAFENLEVLGVLGMERVPDGLYVPEDILPRPACQPD